MRPAERPRRERLASSGFFALRTPLLPFDELVRWSAGLQTLESAPLDQLNQTLGDHRTRLRRQVRAWLAQPAIRDALFVASADLGEAIAVWAGDPDSERGQRV